MRNTLLAAALIAAISGPAMAADCYDGKTDDCTAAWSLAHMPKTPREAKLYCSLAPVTGYGTVEQCVAGIMSIRRNRAVK
jgi:hypothetical protein